MQLLYKSITHYSINVTCQLALANHMQLMEAHVAKMSSSQMLLIDYVYTRQDHFDN